MISLGGDGRAKVYARQKTDLREVLIIAVHGGSGVPFQLVFGAYCDKFVASIVKESRFATFHATIQVSKKKGNLGLGQELLAFSPGHIWWEIESVEGVGFVTECDGVGGSIKDLKVIL